MGAVLHLDRKPVAAAFQTLSRLAVASAATLALAACGSNYRPVVSSINPVGPAGQPTKYAVAISQNGPGAQGLVTLIDFSGDTVVNTTLIGVNPLYFNLAAAGFEGYTLNGDGTLTSFSVSSSLLASQVLQTTLFPGSKPVTLVSEGSNIYIAEQGRNAVAQLANLPPSIQQELPTGANPVYTVTANSSPRVYALAQGAVAGGNGIAVPIETAANTTDTPIPVGIQPVYGVMTADSRRAFILNKGSNSVTVINAQSNALDTFNITGTQCAGGTASSTCVQSTIPVGTAPVWADFAPTVSELFVLNQGNGTTPGSVSVISIPLCSQTTVVTNPNCDVNNPIDANGFGQVLATIPVGVNAFMVAVMQDGTQAFVANAGNSALPCSAPTAAAPIPNCSVSIINLATFSVIATIPAVASTNPADAFIHGRPNWISVTTGTPTGKAYVTAGDSSDISVIRSETDVVQAHLALQGTGVSVRTNQP